jgi:hypothetical protein
MAREIERSWEGRVSRRLRKKIEMLFAHLKCILKLDRLKEAADYSAALFWSELKVTTNGAASHSGGRGTNHSGGRDRRDGPIHAHGHL